MSTKSKNSKLTAFFKKLVKPAPQPKKKEAVKMIVKKKPVVKVKSKPVQKKLVVKKSVKKPLKSIKKPVKKVLAKKPVQKKLVLKPVKKVAFKKPVKVVKHVVAKPAKNVFTKPKATKVELAKETKQRKQASIVNAALTKEKPGHKVLPKVQKVLVKEKLVVMPVKKLEKTKEVKVKQVKEEKPKKDHKLTEEEKEKKRLEEEKYLEKLKEKRKNQPTDFERYAITDSDYTEYDDYDLDDDEN